MVNETIRPFCEDHVDLTGMLSLWLTQTRADFLKGQMVSVNWDVDELEQRAKEIQDRQPLKLSWCPILPIEGGAGYRVQE